MHFLEDYCLGDLDPKGGYSPLDYVPLGVTQRRLMQSISGSKKHKNRAPTCHNSTFLHMFYFNLHMVLIWAWPKTRSCDYFITKLLVAIDLWPQKT